eukprot:scaffold109694_cov31-Tisochrysis_lutea.AAC.1
MLALVPLATVPSLGAYYTCRHTYERALIEELQSAGVNHALSPYPGLVHTPAHGGHLPDGSGLLDPVYALQLLPDVRVVHAESTAELARAALDLIACAGKDGDGVAWDKWEEWDAAPRGSLSVHTLVPDVCKGSPKPRMGARAERIGELVREGLRKRYRFARGRSEGSCSRDCSRDERWLLQLLLLESDTLGLALCRCQQVGAVGGWWPNWRRTAGLADDALAPADKIGRMPSSAYRKLLEAFDCMERVPDHKQTAVDLGASPGSWTAALRKYGCLVTSVDRSSLDEDLMHDPGVKFVEGDAFSFSPLDVDAGGPGKPVDWLVSDVIAFPERVTPLLRAWCGGRWATEGMVVTMKFKGDDPNMAALDDAMRGAEELGYNARAKHFFSNKNEVTIMLAPEIE